MKFKYFQLVWLDGKIEIVKGTDIQDALAKAEYGSGALDYFKEVEVYSND